MTSSSARSKHSATAHLLLVLVTLVWGTTFPLVKAALRDVSPMLFNLLRMSSAALLLFALNGSALQQLSWAQVRLCAVAGLFLGLGYELQTVGLARTTPSKSAFLTGLVVVFVPLLSALPGVRSEGVPRPRVPAYLGALVAFAGVVLLTSEPRAGFASLAGMHLGEWLTLGCALAYAFHMLTVARGAEHIHPRALGTLQVGSAAAVTLLLLPLERHTRLRWSLPVILALAVTSIFATAAAFTIQSWVQRHLPATHTALICTSEPIFAWLTSLLFLGERLGPRAIFGAILILGGILLAELGPTAVSQAAILPMEP